MNICHHFKPEIVLAIHPSNKEYKIKTNNSEAAHG